MAAKRRMAGFSIETDDEVLVNFDDGSTARLKQPQLNGLLTKDEVAQINRSFRLRQSFWRRHLPRGLAVAVAGTAAAAAFLATGRPLTHLVVPQNISASQAGPQFKAANPLPVSSPSPKPSAVPAAASAAVTSFRNPEPSSGGNGNGASALVHRMTAGLGRVLK